MSSCIKFISSPSYQFGATMSDHPRPPSGQPDSETIGEDKNLIRGRSINRF